MANEKGGQIVQLLERMKDVQPLENEPDFFTDTQTLARFLKARDWNVVEAEQQLRATVEWRRKTRPLYADCTWCHEQPGYHGIRQVGFDECGRPVIYACFAQAVCRKTTVEDTIAHSLYLVENAHKTMSGGVNTWVFIIDCTGMTLPACNPRVGYGVSQILADHYPEQLGLVICINHNPVFQSVWNAIKVFLHANTVAKMHMIKSKKKIRETFERHFDQELATWLLDEIALNKQKPLRQSQKEFWRAPTTSTPADPHSSPDHDPRGCPSYVTRYIDRYMSDVATLTSSLTSKTAIHRPHPNIVDVLRGAIVRVDDTSLKSSRLSPSSSGSHPHNNGADDDDDEGNGYSCEGGRLQQHGSSSSDDEEDGAATAAAAAANIDIAEEFQIPKDAIKNFKM